MQEKIDTTVVNIDSWLKTELFLSIGVLSQPKNYYWTTMCGLTSFTSDTTTPSR